MGQTQDVIAGSQRHLLAVGSAVREKFLGEESWGSLALEADRLWRAATTMQQTSLKLRTITKEQLSEAEHNVVNLLELKFWALSMPSGEVIPAVQRMNIANTLVQPYYWLAQVGSPILYRQADIQDFFKDVANLPGTVANWTLKQLMATLGLPAWALPVMGLLTVAGVGLFAYNTFLAPVGGKIRLARSLKRLAQ